MIDESDRTALAICDHCGRRELHADRAAARRWLAEHEERGHRGLVTAREALRVAMTRRDSQMAL